MQKSPKAPWTSAVLKFPGIFTSLKSSGVLLQYKLSIGEDNVPCILRLKERDLTIFIMKKQLLEDRFNVHA